MRMSIVASLLAGAIRDVCMAGHPAELRDQANRIAPKVRLVDDAAFFAAWNLDNPGMEQVKAAVDASDYAKAKIALKRYFLQRRKPVWKINHWDMPEKPKGKPQQHPKYKAGEDVLAHRFSGGGYSVDFGEKIDWDYFPVKFPDGRRDTAYTLTHNINRFKHFSTTLGPLYWFSHDEKYAKEFVYEVTDFVLSHPAPEKWTGAVPGPWQNLTSVIPLVGTWLGGYNYFLSSEHFTAEAHAVMLKGFIEKARYAVRNPNSVNRYLIQLTGIYNVGAYFPELKQAEGFRDLAVRAMTAAMAREFYPDSASIELCPGYHGGSCSMVGNMIKSIRLFGYEPPEALVKSLAATYELHALVATPVGGVPAFGDTWGCGNVAKTYRAIINQTDNLVYRWFATHGKEGAPPDFSSTRLPWAGWYVMRSGWDKDALYLCMDAGPLGASGHWHEDFNNFECYAYGERLLSEVGVYAYEMSNKWTLYFRSALAHNVVLVDGFSQKRGYQGSGVAKQPRTNDWHSDDVFDLAWGYYEGKWSSYDDLKGKKAFELGTHHREICFVKNSYWIISDRLTTPGAHTYSQLFHFMPDRTVCVSGADRAGTTDANRANVMLIQVDPITSQVIKGREEPPQGWYSGGHHKKEPAPVLSFDQTSTDGASYDTIVLPLKPGQQPDITVIRLPVIDENGIPVPPTDVCALRIVTPSGTDLYLNDLRQREIGPPNGRIKTAGDLSTDARAAVLRLDPDGRLVACSASAASFLKFKGNDMGEKGTTR
ncbi:MAG: alginate lyase family protein [Lentisphaeria bacterium]|nr:alginate lyase family protein [Lentisphaeria bacterium]